MTHDTYGRAPGAASGTRPRLDTPADLPAFNKRIADGLAAKARAVKDWHAVDRAVWECAALAWAVEGIHDPEGRRFDLDAAAEAALAAAKSRAAARKLTKPPSCRDELDQVNAARRLLGYWEDALLRAFGEPAA